MRYNNNLILKLNLHSFLICNNSMVNFYKKHLWHKLKNNKFKMMDHIKSIKFKNSKLNGMTFNFKQLKKKQYYYINR